MQDLLQKLYGQPATELPPATPALVQAALAALPSPYQQALSLYYTKGLSKTVISSQLNCSPSTLQRTLTRGISLLKQQLHQSPEPAEQVLQRHLIEKLPQLKKTLDLQRPLRNTDPGVNLK